MQILVIVLLVLVGTGLVFTNIYAQEILLSPLKQVQSGISPQNVKCKDGLILVIRPESESPACVKHDTVEKLITRGWMTLNADITNENNAAMIETLTKFKTKTFLNDRTTKEISNLIAGTYKNSTYPYPGIKYELIKYQIEITGSNYQKGFSISSNATAKISGLNEYEKYSLSAIYNNTTRNKITIVSITHDTKYLPDDIAKKAIEMASKDNNVLELFSKYPDAHNYQGHATYLDPSEVQKLKFLKTYGGDIVENKEYSFLSNSSMVLKVGFVSYIPPPDVATSEIPGVEAYLDPTTFKILGSVKNF